MQQKTITEPDHTWFGVKKKAVAVAVITAAVCLSISSASPAHGESVPLPVSADSIDRELIEFMMADTTEQDTSESGSISVSSAVEEEPEPVTQPEPAPAPQPGIGGSALAVAYNYVGVPYVYAGSTPGGFDCSGLVMFSFAQVGVGLPHSADAIGSMGTVIDVSQAVPGDLVYYPGQHIGFWVSPGQMLDAAVPGTTIGVHQIWGNPLIVRL